VGASVWVILASLRSPVYLLGRGAGFTFGSDEGVVTLAVTTDWPGRRWFMRGAGDAPGDAIEGPWFGWRFFGFGVSGRRWNGEVPVSIRSWGIRFPGPYFATIALAPCLNP
jgi:hypothetical protein